MPTWGRSTVNRQAELVTLSSPLLFQWCVHTPGDNETARQWWRARLRVFPTATVHVHSAWNLEVLLRQRYHTKRITATICLAWNIGSDWLSGIMEAARNILFVIRAYQQHRDRCLEYLRENDQEDIWWVRKIISVYVCSLVHNFCILRLLVFSLFL